ncbi:MAG: hypothetical protein KDD60_11170, partial [Bdellovibrionales bacterium]|nr:hypothetical protein [Bdellovibrionales bacterium]
SEPSREALQPFIFSLGIIEMLSYWKATCSPTVRILCGDLAPDAIDFWREIFYLGLGEFRFTNSIDISKSDFVTFDCHGPRLRNAPPDDSLNGNLVPVGGGKDSIVSLQFLKDDHESNTILLLNPRPACNRTCEIAEYKGNQVYIVRRVLDSRLLELNKAGYLNGHTPFSALLAFTSALASTLCGTKNIILSNESSASEGNLAQSDVNHQYSKSFQFEQDFQNYIKQYVTESIRYFSLLRPLNELQICQRFAQLTQFHNIFRSCNVGCYTDSWCGSCPKCLFTAIALCPFISREESTRIFGADLFERTELHPVLTALYRESETKPFECVGTKEEVRAAVEYLLTLPNYSSSPLLGVVKSDFPTPSTEPLTTLLTAWNTEHAVPEEYFKKLISGQTP